MRISETPDRLTVRDTPGALWLLGLAFVASGSFVLSIPFWSPEWRAFVLWERLAVLAIGAAHLAGGAYSAWRPASTRTDFDWTTSVGVQRVRRIWPFARSVTERFVLADVRAIEIVRSSDNDGDPMFQLRLWLAGSRALWLQAQPVHGEGGALEHASRVRRFLGLATIDAA
jgi:hypothetical protein